MNFKRTAILLSTLSVLTLASCNNGGGGTNPPFDPDKPSEKIDATKAIEFANANFYPQSEAMDKRKNPKSCAGEWDFTNTTGDESISAVKSLIADNLILKESDLTKIELKGNMVNNDCSDHYMPTSKEQITYFASGGAEFYLHEDKYLTYKVISSINADSSIEVEAILNKEGYPIYSNQIYSNYPVAGPNIKATGTIVSRITL